MARWSVNAAPDWHFPPLAIANQYKDRETGQLKRQRYRLVLVKCSRYEWIARDRRDKVYLPSGFNETILFGYAADATPLPTYICLPSGLYRSRTGRMVEREGKRQEIISLPGIFFFDGWRVQPSLKVPANVPQTKDGPNRGTPPGTPRAQTKDKDDARQPEEEAQNILAAAYRNQAENGPNTRRAAIRARKYLKVLVDRHGTVIHKVHQAAREHTQQSKSSEATKQQHSAGGSLPKITPELTSELLHCLNAIPDPWPMGKIAIDMEKLAQWVTKMCRLYFADIYARKTILCTDGVIVSYFNSYLNSVHEYSHCEGVLCRKAPQCDLRDPGRGDPGFRHCWSMCLCCTPSFDLALFSFSCFFGCFLSKIG